MLSSIQFRSTRRVCACALVAFGFSFMPTSSVAQLREGTSPREYVVKRGDTLYRIALNHGTTVDAIREINGISGTAIDVGQLLLLDAPRAVASTTAESVPTASAPEQPAGVLSGIETPADEEPLFVEAFDQEEATPTTASIPVAVPEGSVEIEVVISPFTAPNAFDVYYAREGDTFATLAQRLLFPAGLLKVLNPDLKTPTADRDMVVLPIEPSSILYTVRTGDSLADIASWFGVSAEELTASNSLTSRTLQPGQPLRIDITPVTPEPSVVAESASGGGLMEEQASELSAGEPDAPAQEMVAEPAQETAQEEATPVESSTNEDGELVASGAARIYPAQFSGRLMAIGKAYDPKKFTISHATLELGTVVLLTNEATGRKTFAEVTDRPPTGADYLADVSKAVAEVLGLERDGIRIHLQVAR